MYKGIARSSFHMLKELFSSNTRVKLLTVFLTSPGEEFFIRELTRKLGEQINSIRRELNNLKKVGLLKSRSKFRKKGKNIGGFKFPLIDMTLKLPWILLKKLPAWKAMINFPPNCLLSLRFLGL